MNLLKNGTAYKIHCDENSYLIWKWHPTSLKLTGNRHRSVFEYGTTLTVKEGEVAIVVYDPQYGSTHDYIVGPFQKVLTIEHLPNLLTNTPYKKGTSFKAEVFFINLLNVSKVSFEIPVFNVYDHNFVNLGIPTKVKGDVHFRIKDYHLFTKINDLHSFHLKTLLRQIEDASYRYTKFSVANAPNLYNIPITDFETKKHDINKVIKKLITSFFRSDYGIEVETVNIYTIDLDKSCIGYNKRINEST